MTTRKDIDAYIAAQSQAWQQKVLRELRATVHSANPEITEAIKWGAPYFMYGRAPIAWMFCAREWVHFSLPQGALLDHAHGLFEETDNKAARTIKIFEGEPVPAEVIKRLVQEAVDNARAGKRVDLKRPKPGGREFGLPAEYKAWLGAVGLLEEYLKRPFYQQRGWIQWIEEGKTEVTREKRKKMMLIELKHGQYMPNAADRFSE